MSNFDPPAFSLAHALRHKTSLRLSDKAERNKAMDTQDLWEIEANKILEHLRLGDDITPKPGKPGWGQNV